MSKSFRREDVVGKTVIETLGMVKGKVKDVLFNLDGIVTLIVEGADGKENQVSLAKVTGISDHVIVKSDLSAEPSAIGSEKTCRFCGQPLIPGQQWCPSCGKSQS